MYSARRSKASQGFTLIELLVVISIISILAVIGVSVYSGAQGSARDGQRRSEITSVARSIESAKDYSTGIYKYATADGNKDFPKGFPTDPTAGNLYCVQTSNTTTTPPAAPTGTWTTACPVGYTAIATSLSTTTANNLGGTTPDVKSWTLCASLERSTTPFCVKSLTQ